MEEFLTQALVALSVKFPFVIGGYIALTGLYTFVCFIASLTSSPKDDEFLGRLKRFFSLPVSTPKQPGQ